MESQISSLHFVVLCFITLVAELELGSTSVLQRKPSSLSKKGFDKSQFISKFPNIHLSDMSRDLAEDRMQWISNNDGGYNHQKNNKNDVSMSILLNEKLNVVLYKRDQAFQRNKRSTSRRQYRNSKKSSFQPRQKLGNFSRPFKYPFTNPVFSISISPKENVLISPLLNFGKGLHTGGLINVNTQTISNASPFVRLRKAYLEVFFRSERRHQLQNMVLQLVQRKNGRNFVAARGKLRETWRLNSEEYRSNRYGWMRMSAGRFQFQITDLVQEVNTKAKNSTEFKELRQASGWRIPNLKISLFCFNQRRHLISCARQGITMFQSPRLLLRTYNINSKRYGVKLR